MRGLQQELQNDRELQYIGMLAKVLLMPDDVGAHAGVQTDCEMTAASTAHTNSSPVA